MRIVAYVDSSRPDVLCPDCWEELDAETQERYAPEYDTESCSYICDECGTVTNPHDPDAYWLGDEFGYNYYGYVHCLGCAYTHICARGGLDPEWALSDARPIFWGEILTDPDSRVCDVCGNMLVEDWELEEWEEEQAM